MAPRLTPPTAPALPALRQRNARLCVARFDQTLLDSAVADNTAHGIDAVLSADSDTIRPPQTCSIISSRLTTCSR